MEKCPVCGSYLNYEIIWVTGNPVFIACCLCCGHTEEKYEKYY